MFYSPHCPPWSQLEDDGGCQWNRSPRRGAGQPKQNKGNQTQDPTKMVKISQTGSNVAECCRSVAPLLPILLPVKSLTIKDCFRVSPFLDLCVNLAFRPSPRRYAAQVWRFWAAFCTNRFGNRPVLRSLTEGGRYSRMGNLRYERPAPAKAANLLRTPKCLIDNWLCALLRFFAVFDAYRL